MMTTLDPLRASRRRGDVAANFVIRAAVAAPSVQNSQPWHFSSRPGAIRLHADPRRGLPQADPAGREMVISCGAALFNIRLAMRHLGFAVGVTLLPDPSCPDLLAEIRWGWRAPPTPEEESLYRAIMRRHTHRGPFAVEAPPPLISDLIRVARQEQAELHVIYDASRHHPLADLIQAAELVQRSSPPFAAERVRWARPPSDRRRDGVPVTACRRQPDGPEFAARGFERGATGWWYPAHRSRTDRKPSVWSPYWPPGTTGDWAGCSPGRRSSGCCCMPRPAGSASRSIPSPWSCQAHVSGSVPSSPAVRTRRCCCALVVAAALAPPCGARSPTPSLGA